MSDAYVDNAQVCYQGAFIRSRFLAGWQFAWFFLTITAAVYSQVGLSWRTYHSGSKDRVTLAYGAGVFVSGSYDVGKVEYSTDGETWTEASTGGHTVFSCITWVDTKFVAVGGHEIAISSDGKQWTSSAPFANLENIEGVAGSGSTLVAVGGTSIAAPLIHVSTNGGSTWSTPVLKGTYPLHTIMRTATQYVAAGQNGIVFTSPTGVVWTRHNLPAAEDPNIYALASSPSIMVATGDESNTGAAAVYTSTNGATWTRRSFPVTGNGLFDMVWTGSLFVATGYGETAYTSPNGLVWTKVSAFSAPAVGGLAWSGTQLLAVGPNGTIASSDAWPLANFATVTDSVYESGGSITVAVTLSSPATTDLSIPVSVGGTAVEGVHFSGIPASVHFAVGQQSANFSIAITDNAAINADKRIELSLGAVGNMHLGDHATEVIMLLDDDTKPAATFENTGRHLRENVGAGEVKVSLSHPAGSPVTVPLMVAAGAGQAGSSRFSGVPAAVSFAVGESAKTFPLAIMDDTTEQPDEDITLSLGTLAGAVPGAIVTCTFTVEDNDPGGRAGRRWYQRNPLPKAGGSPNAMAAAASCLKGIVWSGTQFLAVGGKPDGGNAQPALIMSSPDGITWTNRPGKVNGTLNSVAWSGTRYVAVGNSGLILTSSDGIAWIKGVSPGGALHLNAVIWAADQFVAVGGLDENDNARTGGHAPVGSLILTSPDGLTWTRRTSYGGEPFESIAWNGSTFVAVGRVAVNGYEPVIVTTSNTADWSNRVVGPVDLQNLKSIVWDGSQFIAFAKERGIEYSPDGLVWTTAASVPPIFAITDSSGNRVQREANITGSCWTGHDFIATTSDGGTLVSTDGDHWTSHLTETDQPLNAIVSNGVMAVAVGDNATIVSSGTGTPGTPVAFFAQASSTVSESAGTVNLLVRLEPAPATSLAVPFDVTPGTGLVLKGAGADVILPPTRTLVFNPGETGRYLTFKIINDLRDEDNETLTFSLQDPAGGPAGKSVTHTVTISNDDVAPVVSITSGQNAILPAGDPSRPLFLRAEARGSPPLSYQWLLNGRPVAGATKPYYYLPSAAISNAGAYVCSVTNPVARAVPSATVEIGVIESLGREYDVKGDKDVILSQAASANVTFRWNVHGSEDEYLPGAADARYSATKNTLTLLKGRLDYTQGLYECRCFLKTRPEVSLPGDLFTVWVATEAPELHSFDFPLDEGTVGISYNSLLEISSGNMVWTVTGLPPGLAYDPVTDNIAGIPAAAGTFTITITATNALGSASHRQRLVVHPPPEPFVGTMTGMLDPDPTNRLLGGLITLTVTKDGHFTGSYATAGTLKQPFTGQAGGDGGSTFGDTRFYLGGKIVHLGFNYRETTEDAASSGGSLEFDDPGGTGANAVTVKFNLLRPLTRAAAGAFVARYNFSTNYDSTPAPGENVPRGVGFGSATVSASGNITWSGRLGDGTSVFTASSAMAVDGTAPLYLPLYNGRGSYFCSPAFSTVDGSIGAFGSGTCLWTKLPDPSVSGKRSYPEGWEMKWMTLMGGKWRVPGRTEIVMGLDHEPGRDNAVLRFTDAGLDSLPVNPYIYVNIRPGGFIDPVPADSNPCRTTLAINPATGAFGGTFNMTDEMPNGALLKRSATYYGLIVQYPGEFFPTNNGVGSFILPQIPSAAIHPMPAAASTPILAGGLSLYPN